VRHGRLATIIAAAIATVAAIAAVPATAAAPTAVTGQASSVTSTSATLNGTVNAGGVASSYRFNYGTTSLNQSSATQTSSSASATAVSAKLTGLVPRTKYTFQLVVLQSGSPPKPALGAQVTFTTSAPPVPDAVTGAATALTTTTATLHGTIDPHGSDALYEFQYGTSTAYAQTSAAKSLQASGATAVSIPITKLKAGTTYHYRVVELLGSYPSPTPEYGAGKTFTTPASGTYGVASLTSKRIRVSHNSASISIKCSGSKGAQCRGKVSISSHGKSCGSGTIASSTGHTHVIKGRLSSGCATLLKKAKGHKLAATLTATFSTHQTRLKSAVTLVG
jgi:hypothetical protein